MITMGHHKRAKDRRALLEQVSDLYWLHRDSWTPTSDLARDLGIAEETASGLVAQARRFGVLEHRRPRPDLSPND